MGAELPSTDVLLADQRGRWRKGDRVRVEQFLDQRPGLKDNTDVVLDLIYGEVLLRREAGERPAVDEYLSRFPTLADPIRLQFEVDEAIGPTRIGEESLTSTGPTAEAAAPPAPPGYEILKELGRGGMGVVYLARQLKLNRLVALKMIRSGELADPAERARFDAEAQAVARLSHANVVQVYEVGEHQGRPFLALEYVPGGSLADALKGPPLAPRPAAALAATLARAIHHAHEQGIVHRDLKPANILVQNDERGVMSDESRHSSLITHHSSLRPKVTDFGLAKRLDSDGLTRTEDFVGTPNFAAPEQAAGRNVGPPADVWALGGILYMMLTGRPPFAGDSPLETLDQVRFADPVPPSRLRPNLPRDLETIALTCLRKDASKRYSSAAGLADDLERFVRGEAIRARPVGAVERAVKWCRRRPAVAGLLGLVVLLTAAALVTVTTLWRRESVARQGERDQREQAVARSAELLVANARLAWLTGDFAQARSALGEVPEAFRDRDWRYLTRATAPPLMDATVPGDMIMRMVFRSDGRRLAAVTNRGKVCVWDPATGHETVTVPNLFSPAIDLAFTADGRLAIATYETRPFLQGVPQGSTDVSFVDTESGEVVDSWTRPERARTFDLGPGARYAAFVSYVSPSVDVMDGMTGRVLHRIDGFSTAGAPYVAFNSNGTLLAVQGYKQDVRVWSPAAGAEVRRMTLTDADRDQVIFALHPDGTRFGMRAHQATQNSRILVRSAQPDVAPISLPRYFAILTALVFSPDGKTMAGYGSAERFASIWDVQTGLEVMSLRGHNDRLTTFAFSPDSRSLAIGCANGRVAVWGVGD